MTSRMSTKRSRNIDDDSLYEIVDGELIKRLSKGVYAAIIAGRLGRALIQHVDDHPIGWVTVHGLFILDSESDLRRRPDVAVVTEDRWALDREVPESGDWEVVPTIAVEVTSTHDTFSEVHSKVIEYLEHGVEEVWVVFTDEQQVYRYTSPTDADIKGEQDVFEGGERLPGFSLTLSDLFRRKTGSPSPSS